MASDSRLLRIGDMIQRVLASQLLKEVQDPRLKLVSISGVEVSKDLAHAKIFISYLGPDEKLLAALEALKKAGPYLRRLLAKEMDLRTVPELHFVRDETSEYGSRMSALIDKARRADEQNS